MTTMNPFLVQSTLPIWLPILIKFPAHHYRPAFDEEYSKSGQKWLPSRLTRKHLISTNTDSGTGTSGELLTRVTSVFAVNCGAYQ